MDGHKEYYLGLDMGTASVGWAVTDPQYHILRAKGKDLWGVREFKEAETAVARRTNRISRRRRQREVARIAIMRSYFADAINAVDPNFLQRLENSKYYLEDKDQEVSCKSALFNDPDFKDADYYSKYPTIYHLRAALLSEGCEDAMDVRLVYLAVLNMFKHRGNFLNTSLDIDGDVMETDPGLLYAALADSLETCCGDTLTLPTNIDVTALQQILAQHVSKSKKSESVLEILGASRSDTRLKELVRGVCGIKCNLSTVFGEEILDEEGKQAQLTFDSSNYDEAYEKVRPGLNDDQSDVISAMKAMYDSATLIGMGISNGKYLSIARVETYEKHKNDLKILKRLYKRESMAAYNHMFRSYESNSYSAYVGSCNSMALIAEEGHKKRRGVKAVGDGKELFSKIKKDLDNFAPSDDRQYVLDEIANERFLPKQRSSANGVIPNQIHAREMKQILANASKHFSFLNDKDESGLTVSERILQLYTFTIPYYIGPLSGNSEKNGGNGWVVRKEDGPVFPWNLDEKVDQSKTRERFIERLIRDCTYLRGEKVLPKASLLYEKYCVLDEINNIKVHGEKLPVDVKQDLFNTEFKKGKKVSRKAIERYLINQGVVAKDDVEAISGIDVQIKNQLSSYGKFHSIFGENIEKDRYQEIAEDIIQQCTIYGDSRKELKNILMAKYCQSPDTTQNVLSEQDVNRILGMKFKDWGRFSREFLLMPESDASGSEPMSLIDALWNTNYNRAELLSAQFHYADELKRREGDAVGTLTDIRIEDLDDMYFSAPVKRMAWQTLLVIKEIQKVMGGAPSKIFVEMARSPEQNKKRTTSRAEYFRELYKNIQDESRDWMQIIDDAEKDGTINSKKMFLYLTQMGRSMYTGKEISLSDLFRKDSPYDIDHIYPRSQTKDDSLVNNLVLVEQERNRAKRADYPIDDAVRTKMHEYWKMLLTKGGGKERFITREKYDRLTGTNPLSEDQLAGFIARQMVETQQATKSVANLLQAIMPKEETKIVFSKAANVSDFRYHYNDEERRKRGKGVWYFPKSRTINELHHAHDAYLNIVVGNVYDVKFGDPRLYIREYERDEKKYAYNLARMFDWDIKRNGYTAWEAGENGTIAVIKKTLAKPSPLLTRMVTEGHGKLSEATLHGKLEAQKHPENYTPFKARDKKLEDVTRYGGFSALSTAYFTLVEYEKKGKIYRSIEAVPLCLEEKIKQDRTVLIRYLENQYGYENISIKIWKIKLNSLLRLNGYYVYLTGKDDNNRHAIRNATQLFFDVNQMTYISRLEKGKQMGVSESDNMALYKVLVSKHGTAIMGKRPTCVYEILLTGEGKFGGLSIEKQVDILLKILSLTGVDGYSADLTDIGGGKTTGRMRLAKNITKNKEVILIHQSVTGLYEEEVNLLTV